MPRPERDTLSVLPLVGIRLVMVLVPEKGLALPRVEGRGLFAGLTHNEVRALLGIWRT